MGNIHIANGSTKTLRVRATQERVTITQIESSANISVKAFQLSGTLNATFNHTLDEQGFARLGPGEALEFDVDRGRGDVFVSVTTADDPSIFACYQLASDSILTPTVIAYNFTPPENRSVIVTDKNTLQLSQKHGDIWKTDSGVCYTPQMATNIKIQGTPAAAVGPPKTDPPKPDQPNPEQPQPNDEDSKKNQKKSRRCFYVF